MAHEKFDRQAFEEEVAAALEGFSPKEVVAFAWRCGVRALPLSGARGDFGFWKSSKKRHHHLYQLFRALDSAAADAAYAASADAALASAAADAASATSADATSASAAASAASAADAASATAYASASAAASAAAFAASAAASAAAFAASAAAYATSAASAASRLEVPLAKAIRKDLLQLKQGGGRTVSMQVYGEVWPSFLHALEQEGCGYWSKLVQQWFASGLQTDKEAAKRRLAVPKEIQAQGAVVVGKYLEELERKGASHLNEARIIILGDKGAGKTSIARKLVDPSVALPKPEESTPGVDTTLWELEEHDFNVRIWDFAGHTVTHAVHQFFLSERCLYILVCNGRTEEYNRLEYWLSQMQIYGGSSQVLLLVNQKDPHLHNIPINKLKQKYPIIDLQAFSLLQDMDSIRAFRKTVVDYILNHPTWQHQQIPKPHYQVKEQLESFFEAGSKDKVEEMIEMTTFDEIAASCEVTDKKALLRDLHALGISLWYEDIEGIDTLVLNPEWISHGIYTIINWVHQQEGHGLSLGQFEAVFEKEKPRYPKKRHVFLFKLMKHYQLAFETKKGNARYLIIPHLLKEDQPIAALLPTFSVGESLMLRYKSEIDLPGHLISRFIVEHHEDIALAGKEKLVWREGVVLKKGQNWALAVEDDRTLSVSVKGPEKTEYLDELRGTLKVLFDAFKKQKPELQYRVEEFGEIIDEAPKVSLRNVPKEAFWASESDMLTHHLYGESMFDTNNKARVNIERVLNFYGVKANEFNVEKEVTNTYNFHQCNIGLQGNFNELASKLAKEGYKVEAEELTEVANTLDENKDLTTPEDIKKKGLGNQVKRVVEALADEKSTLHRGMNAVRNGKKIAGEIMGWYNQMVQKGICPPIEPFF